MRGFFIIQELMFLILITMFEMDRKYVAYGYSYPLQPSIN